MKDNTIELKGIVRNRSILMSEDGTCEDVVNLRYKDGSWRSCGEGKPIFGMLPNYKFSQLYIHTQVYRHMLGVLDGNLYWFANVDADGHVEELALDTPLLEGVEGEIKYSQVGHLLTVIDAERKVSLLYDEVSNSYKDVTTDRKDSDTNKVIPNAFGNVKLKLAKRHCQRNGEDKGVQIWWTTTGNAGYGESAGTVTSGYDVVADPAQAMSGYHRIKRVIKNRGGIVAPCLGVVAARMYDGSYRVISPVFFLNPNEQSNEGEVYTNSTQLDSYLTEIGFDRFTGQVQSQGIEGEISVEGKAEIDGKKRSVQPVIVPCVFNSKDGYLDEVDLYNNAWKEDDSFIGEEVYEGYNAPLNGKDDHVERLLCVMNNKTDNDSDTVADDYSLYGFIHEDSLPSLWDCASLMSQKVSDDKDTFTNDSKQFVCGTACDVSMSIHALPENAEDIYSDICLFLTPQVDIYNDTHKGNYTAKYADLPFTNHDVPDIFTLVSQTYFFSRERKAQEDFEKELMGYPFYLASELKYGEALNVQGSITFKIDDGVLLDENLVQSEVLPSSAFLSWDTRISAGAYNYNGRLHEYGGISEAFRGYPYDLLRGVYDNDTSPSFYDYKTDAENISIRVKRNHELQECVRVWTKENDEEVTDLQPFVSYPSIDATQMEIKTLGGNVGGFVKTGYVTKELKRHSLYPFSYYLTADLKPIQLINGQETTEDYASKNLTRHVDSNVIYVSKTDNPLYFPASQVYPVGSSEIIGMCSNAVAVGTGQTGNAPLYVFCKDGVYVLMVDSSGEVAYRTARIIARDVCNNPNSIVPTDMGVVFSTDRGLMMMNGEQVVEIGQSCEGEAEMFMLDQSGDYIPVASSAFLHKSIGDFSGKESVSFLDYIKGSIIGYNHHERELIVSNPDYDWSYVMDRNGQWTRHGYSAEEYVNNYPSLYRLSGLVLYNLGVEENEHNHVFLLSNTLKLGNVGFKQGYRFAVRGRMRTEFDVLKGADVGHYTGGESDDVFGVMCELINPYLGIERVWKGRSYTFEITNTSEKTLMFGLGYKRNPVEYEDVNISDYELCTLEAHESASVDVTIPVSIELEDGAYDSVWQVVMWCKQADDSSLGEWSADYHIYPADSRLGLYVFGSYDGVRWGLLGGNEKKGQFSDIGCQVSRVDCKYFRVCLSGSIADDSRIDYMEMTSTDSRMLGGKIR